MSRTKIVATYGPACTKERTIGSMLRGGLDVMRLNLSHLDPDNLAETVTRLRRIAAEASVPLAILADMPGPKIRCTVCEPQSFTLKEGDRVTLSSRKVASTPTEIAIAYPHLIEDVKAGHELAINDGLVLLRVEKVHTKEEVLHCVVLTGGEISSRKGVSFPHSTLRISSLTTRDRKGLRAAAQAEVDFVALSFVRSADDIAAARRILGRAGRSDMPLVAKIETRQAVERISEIVEASHAVMVARGDMGIERPFDQVPLLQKDIIACCNRAGKPVITATQMVESMITSSRPTRAEVSDVANAILDGTDAVMLSAETAVGCNPGRVVRTMAQIASTAETRIDHQQALRIQRPGGVELALNDSLARAACQLALDARLDALVCFSSSGQTAQRIARYRPTCPVYVLTPNEQQCRRLALTWGLDVFQIPRPKLTQSRKIVPVAQLVEPAVRTLLGQNRLKKGHRIAMLAGRLLGKPGGTNRLEVVEI